MKKINILMVVSLLAFALSGWSAYGHGEGMGMTGSAGMMEMMDLMHDQMDGNRALNCEQASDGEMMEIGEEMMEEMMGHEDHEKMEESLNLEDHDSMHMMMGMWASGCVGDEAMNTMMDRYGIPGHLDGGYRGQTDWSPLLLGIIIGALGFWAVGRFASKKVIPPAV